MHFPGLQSKRPQLLVSPLKDVRLGPLITKTSNGRLYRATWKDKIAVVKVRSDTKLVMQHRG